MQPISVLPPAGPTPGRTLGAVLRKRAAERPDDRAYVFVPSSGHSESEPLTYAQLDRRARAVAAYLGTVAAPGSRVLLAFPTGADFAGAVFGCLLAGMVAVPVQVPAGAEAEHVERALRACTPAVLLAEPEWAHEWRDLADTAKVHVAEADGLSVGAQPASWLAGRWRPVGVMPGSAAYLRYVPEEGRDETWEAAFTHSDVLATLSMLSRTSRLGLDDRHLGWLAGVHGLELVWQVLLPVYEGRTAHTPVP